MIEQRLRRGFWTIDAADMISLMILDMSRVNHNPVVKALYRERGLATWLEVLAGAAAYRKAHGAYPTTLGGLIDEASLSAPFDPATGRQTGYRLEDGRPLVWVAGFDNVDNGGLRRQPENDNDFVEDSDLIFSLE